MKNAIANALRPGTNFASVEYITQVKTAAAHREMNIQKHTVANVQLFANIRDARAVFEAAVKRSATKLGEDAARVDAFEQQSNWFTHTDCWSVVQHNKTGALYLYAIFNGADSVWTINGAPATRADVAQYLTPSEANKLLNPPATVHNKTHDVHHTVTVRTIALDNVQRIVVNKCEIRGV